jgi:preprotein translocase subunit SecD
MAAVEGSSPAAFLAELDTNRLSAGVLPAEAVSATVEVLRKRVDTIGVARLLIQPAGANRILMLAAVFQSPLSAPVRILEERSF